MREETVENSQPEDKRKQPKKKEKKNKNSPIAEEKKPENQITSLPIESPKITLLEKTKNYLPFPDFIQKTLAALAIIIPFIFLLIGGIFQVLSLLNIGLPYLRFFSISQLFSDSIIVLIGFFIKVIFPLIVGIILAVIAHFILNLIDRYIKKYPNVSGILGTIVIFTTFFILISILFDFGFDSIFIGTFGLLIPMIFNFLKKKERKIESDEHFNLIASAIVISLIGFYAIAKNTYSGYQLTIQSFLPENNLVNYKKIHLKFIAEGKKDSLLYFNDKYIFIQLKNDTYIKKIKGKNIITYKVTKKEIQILKFDRFFEEDK